MNLLKVLLFLVIAFVWSWISWSIGLSGLFHGVNDAALNRFVILFFIGVYGPALSAVITTLCVDGFSGLLALLKRFLLWKAPLPVYLTIVFFPLAFLSIGIGLYALFIGKTGGFDSHAIATVPHILLLSFLAGPLGEELGWRGVLLPELQQKYSSFKSAVIVGLIWFCWHIPLFWGPFGTLLSGEHFSVVRFIAYLAFVLCLSCIYTWMVNSSKGSLLIAILIHA